VGFAITAVIANMKYLRCVGIISCAIGIIGCNNVASRVALLQNKIQLDGNYSRVAIVQPGAVDNHGKENMNGRYSIQGSVLTQADLDALISLIEKHRLTKCVDMEVRIGTNEATVLDVYNFLKKADLEMKSATPDAARTTTRQ